MKVIQLDGSWELFPVPLTCSKLITPGCLKTSGLISIPASVPGDIELDCAAAGLAPADPFYGMNAEAFRKFENHSWFYIRKFTIPEDFSGKMELVAEGIDCCAEIFIDDQKIGSCENALIPHRFSITAAPGEHEIAVRILSARQEAKKYPAEAGEWPQNAQVFNRLTLRKCAHSWGWDITPRFICGGIFRSIRIEEIPEYRIEPVFARTNPESVNGTANVFLFYHYHEPEYSGKAAAMRFTGKCGESKFSKLIPLESVSGYASVNIKDPERWDIAGYGKPNLYDLQTELLDRDGNILATRNDRFGIRTLSFNYQTYQFTINGKPVRLRGINWSPADAFHSRIASRMPVLLKKLSDLQCNIVRCWGGGVYESEEFFNFCDENGILVWQDFAMACGLYPQQGKFVDLLKKEADTVISRLRRHPSLAIWCGDNECDQFYVELHRPPEYNQLTRKILPEALFRLDPDRPYVSSSPAVEFSGIKPGEAPGDPERIFSHLTERHLWGARINFRDKYYNPDDARFIGETGWHGAPALESIKRFLTPASCRVDFNNVEWIMHGSDAFRRGDCFTMRPHTMRKQLLDYFGFVPDNMEDFVSGSQLFQIEALRYVVQQARLRNDINGFIWWNLADCWPCFSEALVDYFNVEKPAFSMLRELYKPFAVMLPDDGVYAVNDTDNTVNGTISWKNGSESGIFNFTAAPGISKLALPLPECDLFTISWESDCGSGVNHRLRELPKADFEFCRKNMAEIFHYSGVN
ncbi:MAG: hypothetical protein J6W00_08485 [Lentisphaeria bacterium]|nr:hypothetical protein [Lentisphaeria bacterium]